MELKSKCLAADDVLPSLWAKRIIRDFISRKISMSGGERTRAEHFVTSSRLAVLISHFSYHQLRPSMASEKVAALAAVPSDSPTVFDKIINKEIPSNVVYEDDKVLAFRDIAPQAPTHIVIIPKVKDGLTGLSKAEERHCEILGYLLYTAKLIAKQEGLEDGFRLVINDGPNGCQSVYHLHIHLLGGRQMNWPPG